MTVIPFLVVAFGAGGLSLLVRRAPGPSAAIGVAGLLLALLTAALIGPEPSAGPPGLTLAGSPALRTFLVLGCLSALLLLVVGAAGTFPRIFPGATLCTLGAAALALAVREPVTALVAATGAALAATLVAVPGAGTKRGLSVAIRELRALAVAGIAAIVAVGAGLGATVGTEAGPAPAGGPPPGPLSGSPIVALAWLGLAAATALRLGAIPFHLRAARIADVAPGIAMPLVAAWAPAAFALVAIATAAPALAPGAEVLAGERALVVLLAAASILAGTWAAIVHDDLEHVVAYAIVADAGFALLALAALDPAAHGAAWRWLLVVALGRSAFAAWAGAVRAGFDRGRVSELSGWARRAPGLAAALLLLGSGMVGWPGTAAWGARMDLVDLPAGAGPVGWLLGLGGAASAAVYARLLWVGLRAPGAAVRAADGLGVPRRPEGQHGPRRLDRLVATWSANRRPAAGVAALVLAVLVLAVGGAGLGLPGPPGPAAERAAGSGLPAVRLEQAEAPGDAGAYSSGASTQRSISRP